ncbi:uncharacterized protein LOC106640027 [Copidosoma floridanum]|uniref:uncharacterized protein LOC106640027 n=1 Tax=Copidosoma floridanum TaxID=29053 RepID=UPI0006C93BD4|nr:uncharacterized protein LOC106640027 [Copidosoma floridanum]
MNTFAKTSIAMVMVAGLMCACEAGVLAAAPVAPAAIGYTHVVPHNVFPFASRVDLETRVRAAPLLAPLAAHPLLPAPAHHAPLVAAPGPIAAAVPPFFAPAHHALAAPYALPAPFFS